VRLREDHVRARTAASNQLGALLEAYWPGPKAVFYRLASLPGVGTINLAQLLAEVGPILDRVDSAEHAAAECGAAPVTKASGKTSGVYFRWAANRRARKALTTFAHNSRLASPWAGRLYADARARGKRNPTPPASSPVPGSGSSGPAGNTPPPTTPPCTPPLSELPPAQLDSGD
jgi:transposase